MASDIHKHLDRAKRFLEKNRVEDAIEAYLAVIDEAPRIRKRRRRWGICTRGWNSRTARRCTTECCSICWWSLGTRSRRWRSTTGSCGLRRCNSRPSALRVTRFCNRSRIDLKRRSSSTRRRRRRLRREPNRRCAVLPGTRRAAFPRKFQTTTAIRGVGRRSGKSALAARAFLRAGQLATANGAKAEALEFLGRAYQLAPQERSVALLYSEATLRSGDAQGAAALLEPFAATRKKMLRFWTRLPMR